MLQTFCKYTITVHRKDQTTTKIVNEDSFTIGRSVDCTLPLSDDSISRVHLAVHRRQDQIWIEDKGSSNGTFVNNVRLAPNNLVHISPTDRIRLGKSDYVLTIRLELGESHVDSGAAVANSDATDVLPQSSEPAPAIVPKSTEKEKKSEILSKVRPVLKEENKSEAAGGYNNNHPQFEGERIVHEARKKAAQIIYDGELQAEKRAQAIYLDARERKAQAEAFYQKHVQDAHNEAGRILKSYEIQGQELLEQARKFAQDIRDEVEAFANKVKEEAQKEAEQIDIAAREEANLLRQEAYEKARTQAEIEAEDLVVSAKAESQDILRAANQQASEMLTKARNEMESELAELKELLENKRKELQAFKKEKEEVEIKARGEIEDLEVHISNLKVENTSEKERLENAQRKLLEVSNEEANLSEKIRDHKKAIVGLENQIHALHGDNKTLEKKKRELQEQLAHLNLDIKSSEDQKRLLESELSQQKALVKERLEKERQRLTKESEDRMQDAQLEISKRMQKFEQDMFEEIFARKDALVKDILVVVETRIAKVLETAKWDQVSNQIFEGISEAIEGKAVTIGATPKGSNESASLQRKRKKENFRWVGVGLAVGIFMSVMSVQIYSRVKSDKTPMRTLAAEESRRRREDLERRKFNPPQVKEIKESYTDAVIYTAGFVDAYKNPEFQQKLYKEASAYLLKTWRVDEDKSIQVLSMSNALIKELNDKKLSIHPDFIKDGVAKMRSLEKESLSRMKEVLGSEVRLESYRRFERNFFTKEILKK